MCKRRQLIEYMVQDIVDMLTTDQNIEYDTAINFITQRFLRNYRMKKRDYI